MELQGEKDLKDGKSGDCTMKVIEDDEGENNSKRIRGELDRDQPIIIKEEKDERMKREAKTCKEEVLIKDDSTRLPKGNPLVRTKAETWMSSRILYTSQR